MGKTDTFWQYGETDTLGYLGQLDALCRISRVLSAGAGRQDALHHILGVLAGELGLKIVDALKRCNGNLAAMARDLKATRE